MNTFALDALVIAAAGGVFLRCAESWRGRAIGGLIVLAGVALGGVSLVAFFHRTGAH